MIHVFIDANAVLTFYGLAQTELEELRKLAALVAAGELTVWLPDMTEAEVWRNRTKVLAEAVRPLKESRVKVHFPGISESLPARNTLRNAVQAAQRAHSDLLAQIDELIYGRQLEADRVITELFGQATRVPTGRLMQRARDRRDLRTPPGKGDSLGDAINWEALLQAVPEGQNIHLVTGDHDFRSPLGPHLHEALAEEWEEAKQATATLYAEIGDFSSRHFPQVRLASDVPKLRAIQALETSASFTDTHSVVARLARYDLFSPEQAKLLLRNAAANSQVRWIAGDEDVRALLRRVIDAHRDHVDSNDVAVLEQEMHPPQRIDTEVPDEDLPF